MIEARQCFIDCINAPVRNIEGRVELYEGSTLIDTFTASDHLKNFKVERTGEEGKFFGFGVSQKLVVQLVDHYREINITPAQTIEAAFGTGCEYTYTNPLFYVEDVKRDENTNELTITAYDILYTTPKHTVSELQVALPYTMKEFVVACAVLLHLPLKIVGVPEEDTCFDTEYPAGANLDGTETIRQVLDAVAEATQTIYYIDYNWNLVFRRLDKSGEPVMTISKDKYFTLKNETSKTIAGLAHITELGDNVEAVIGEGIVQYVRDNPFWDLRIDLSDLLTNAANFISGLTIHQFDLSWRGNYLLEIGDKIEMVSKDNTLIQSFILNDTIIYDGGLKQTNKWTFADKSMETPTNPANLGAALNQTFARVDKVNKEIELLSSEVTLNSESIASLKVNTDSISASVSQVQTNVETEIDNMNNAVDSIRNEVNMKMTSEDVKIIISEELTSGVDKISTSTGYTFDQDGLTISKTGSEMTTQITEDGMTVYRNNEAVLIANNEGVKAEDLHATTYLIIGDYSRIENYGSNRTGCFWIGG